MSVRLMSEDVESAILAEAAAVSNVQRLANEIAEAARPISRQGDGNCGIVIETILCALEAKGLYVNPRSLPKNKPKKQVISPGLRKLVLERDEYRCVSCGTFIDLCCDHIYPESKGGETTLDNLQAMCRPCNSVKGAKT